MHRLIRISKMCDFNCQTGRRKCDGLRLLCSVQGWSFVQTERHLKATQLPWHSAEPRCNMVSCSRIPKAKHQAMPEKKNLRQKQLVPISSMPKIQRAMRHSTEYFK